MLAQLKSKIPALLPIPIQKILLALLIVFLFNGCNRSTTNPQLTGLTMGTQYSVQWRKLPDSVDPRTIKNRVETRLQDINDLMSTYLPHSQLNGFNRSRETGWHAVEPELAELVHIALNISKQSNGAFDITVGPLVSLWGFGPTETEFSFPSSTEIRIAKRSIGYHHVQARLNPAALNKKLGDVVLDLSAIAKGYAVDQIAEILDAENVEHYMVEVGGEVKGKGLAPHGKPWRIGIETPDTQRGNIEAVVSLDNVGVATSGDYRNFIEHEGKRYSHAIDPRTGYPVKHYLRSVTVIHESVALADAWATAFLVLGADKAYKLAQQKDMAILLITQQDKILKTTASDAMKKYISPK